METYQQLYLVYKSKKSVYGASDFFGIDKTVEQLELEVFKYFYYPMGLEKYFEKNRCVLLCISFILKNKVYSISKSFPG